MILASAKAGDLARADKYLAQALETERPELRPHRNSFKTIVRSMVKAGEPKRAHHWMEDFVTRGCSECREYSPEAVKLCASSLRSMRPWNLEDHITLVQELAKSLADAGNAVSANHWLGYLHKCGQAPSSREASATYDYVRCASPLEIVPARLSVESPTGTRPEAAKRVPALLSGEREQDRQRFLAKQGMLMAPSLEVDSIAPSAGAAAMGSKGRDSRLSQASTRAGSSLARHESSCRATPLPLEPLRTTPRGKASASLQRLLKAKKRTEEVANVCAARHVKPVSLET